MTMRKIMKGIRWLLIGAAVAAVIGFVLYWLWNALAGIFAGVVVLVLIALATSRGGMFDWDDDDNDDDDEEEEENDD